MAPRRTSAIPTQHPVPVIDKDLLEILACPATLQPLALADAALVARVNAAIAAGRVKNVGGKPVAEALPAALVRKDGQIVYAIRDEIPILLVDEGIPVPRS
jgi:uncharacterized protein YbaR (Trm112 family)